MDVIRQTKEIKDVLVKAEKQIAEGSKFFGMSYEEGIVNMYDWLIGNTDNNPMDD